MFARSVTEIESIVRFVLRCGECFILHVQKTADRCTAAGVRK